MEIVSFLSKRPTKAEAKDCNMYISGLLLEYKSFFLLEKKSILTKRKEKKNA